MLPTRAALHLYWLRSRFTSCPSLGPVVLVLVTYSASPWLVPAAAGHLVTATLHPLLLAIPSLISDTSLAASYVRVVTNQRISKDRPSGENYTCPNRPVRPHPARAVLGTAHQVRLANCAVSDEHTCRGSGPGMACRPASHARPVGSTLAYLNILYNLAIFKHSPSGEKTIDGQTAGPC